MKIDFNIFRCDLCGKGFIWKEGLTKHTLTHKINDGTLTEEERNQLELQKKAKQNAFLWKHQPKQIQQTASLVSKHKKAHNFLLAQFKRVSSPCETKNRH